MIVILLNMVAMALEYNNMPRTFEDALDYVNLMFVSVFTMECFMKLLALRLYYFKEPWNIFDFVIVVVSVLSKAATASHISLRIVIASISLYTLFQKTVALENLA